MSSWQDGATSAATRTIKSGPGKLYTIVGRNTGAALAYIFFYQSVAKPPDTATSHLFTPIQVLPGASFSLQLEQPRAFVAGLCWAASSTDATLTYASGATFNVSAEYD